MQIFSPLLHSKIGHFLLLLLSCLLVSCIRQIDAGGQLAIKCSDGTPAVLPCDQESKVCEGNPGLGCELQGPAYFCCGAIKAGGNPSEVVSRTAAPSFPINDDDCEDRFKQCEHWAKRGLCFMGFYTDNTKAKLCPKSCRVCHLAPERRLETGRGQIMPAIKTAPEAGPGKAADPPNNINPKNLADAKSNPILIPPKKMGNQPVANGPVNNGNGQSAISNLTMSDSIPTSSASANRTTTNAIITSNSSGLPPAVDIQPPALPRVQQSGIRRGNPFAAGNAAPSTTLSSLTSTLEMNQQNGADLDGIASSTSMSLPTKTITSTARTTTTSTIKEPITDMSTSLKPKPAGEEGRRKISPEEGELTHLREEEAQNQNKKKNKEEVEEAEEAEDKDEEEEEVISKEDEYNKPDNKKDKNKKNAKKDEKRGDDKRKSSKKKRKNRDEEDYEEEAVSDYNDYGEEEEDYKEQEEEGDYEEGENDDHNAVENSGPDYWDIYKKKQGDFWTEWKKGMHNLNGLKKLRRRPKRVLKKKVIRLNNAHGK